MSILQDFEEARKMIGHKKYVHKIIGKLIKKN